MHPTHTSAATRTPPTGEPMPASPANTLRAAADYLRRYGWCQAAYYHHHDGDTAVFPAACAAGAIRVVVCGRPVHEEEPIDNAEHARHIGAALALLADWLRHDPRMFDPDRGTYPLHDTDDLGVVTDFNDHPDSYHHHVITALHDAAHAWDRLHNSHTSAGGAR